MSKFLVILTFSVFVFAGVAKAETLNCTAYDSMTGVYVPGTCNDDIGEFTGYNSTTGTYVSGRCSKSAGVTAYDSSTGAYVYGSCY
jgi:hypothetical protein